MSLRRLVNDAVLFTRVWMVKDTTFLRQSRYLSPNSFVLFGKDDKFWKRIERLAPHKISVFDEYFAEEVGFITRNGVGIWSMRGGHHRGLYHFEPNFRHVFYFSDENDAFIFRMRFISKVGDQPRISNG